MAAQYDISFFSGDISYTDTHRILRIHTAAIYTEQYIRSITV